MAKRLKAATDALGLSDAEVARRLGRDKTSYHRDKSGAGGIPHTVIFELHRVLGITPNYLYTGNEYDLPPDLKDALAKARSNHK
jgi:transcriptional regulator with XRE-family HTH domain